VHCVGLQILVPFSVLTSARKLCNLVTDCNQVTSINKSRVYEISFIRSRSVLLESALKYCMSV
jgi:hypothetical protein